MPPKMRVEYPGAIYGAVIAPIMGCPHFPDSGRRL